MLGDWSSAGSIDIRHVMQKVNHGSGKTAALCVESGSGMTVEAGMRIRNERCRTLANHNRNAIKQVGATGFESRLEACWQLPWSAV
jgi:hypothetical protein